MESLQELLEFKFWVKGDGLWILVASLVSQACVVVRENNLKLFLFKNKSKSE